MTQGWVNLKAKQDQLRAIEKHYREVGWSDGYGGKPAQSLNIEYSRGWTRGRAARLDFDRDNLLNDLDEAS